ESEYEFYNGYIVNEIAITKDAKDPKEWPADRNPVMHGAIKDQKDLREDHFVLTDRNGKQIKMHPSRNIRIKADEGGDLVFSQLRSHLGKMLAVTYQRGKYFNDPLTGTEQYRYAQVYKDQLIPVLQQVDPLGYDEKGNPTGVVQLNGLVFDASKDPIKDWT